MICLFEITPQRHTHTLAFLLHAHWQINTQTPPPPPASLTTQCYLFLHTCTHARTHSGFSFRALLLKHPRMVVHLSRVASGWCEVASLPQSSWGACSVHVCREISPKPDPRGAHLAVPASETGVKTSTYARRFLFFPVSFFSSTCKRLWGGARRETIRHFATDSPSVGLEGNGS